jgi:hypothetical protein
MSNTHQGHRGFCGRGPVEGSCKSASRCDAACSIGIMLGHPVAGLEDASASASYARGPSTDLIATTQQDRWRGKGRCGPRCAEAELLA